MRKAQVCFAALLAFTMQPSPALAGSTLSEFSQVWSDRDARYAGQLAPLAEAAREAIRGFADAERAGSPDAGRKLEQLIDRKSVV